MKADFELLKSDIRDELEKIVLLSNDFQDVLNRVDLSSSSLSQYDRGAIGYYIHNFYNGCENIFLSIARFFENDIGRDSWHSDLLKRMKLEIAGYRPAVIDEKLYRLLNEFRGFRHIFRHAYGFELEWEKERPVALRLPEASRLFMNRSRHSLPGWMQWTHRRISESEFVLE